MYRMKKILQKNIVLLIIVLLAFVLRVYNLGSLPPSLTWDEVSWGYNGYSLGNDLRDEFGEFLPIQYLESFGDFKPPVYAYLTAVSEKVIGLNEFAVRFPSALAGTLTVFLTYFLIKKIIPDKKSVRILHFEINISLLTAFILAISPWHILLSRAAFEANVATLFIVLGVYLFFVSIEGRKTFFILSVLSFIISAYTFNTARIVAPVLLLSLCIGHYRTLFLRKKSVLIAFVIGFIVVLPLLLFMKSPQAKLRYQEVNIFSDIGIIERVNQQHINNNEALWSRVIQNRRLAYGAEYVRHYFDNLTPSFLFIKGDGNPKFSIQDVGQMYLWEIPFFIGGILLLFRRRSGSWWAIPIWILIGIAPAATARETPHALRIETIIPLFQFFTAYGMIYFLSYIQDSVKNKITRTLIFGSMGLIISANFIFFIHNYFFHYAREFSGEWQYGYKEAVHFTESVKSNYQNIFFTEKMGRPYIYVLFYGKYDPKVFRKNAIVEREALGFVTVKKFDKYTFTKDPGQYANEKGKNLFVDVPSNIPADAIVKERIKLLNGHDTFVIYEK